MALPPDCVINTANGAVVTLDCAGPILINILTWLFAFAGIAALLFVILGGFKFLTSGGDKEKVDEARKTITWALIGLVLIFLSFAIVRFIGDVTGATCISGPFNLGRCGLERSTGALQCTNEKPDCGKDRTGSPRDPVCNHNKGVWECSGGI